MLADLMIELAGFIGEIVFEGLLEAGIDFILDRLPGSLRKSL